MATTTPWCCPRCRGRLVDGTSELTCSACRSTFLVVAGIPDLRVDTPAWVNVGVDRARAAALAGRLAGRPAADLIASVFRSRADWREADVARRTSEVTDGPARLGHELDGWLASATASGRFLDLGCGPGQLLAAAARRGLDGIGVDVMLEWLVVARALVAEHGGRAVLAAAMAEALPLPSGTLGGVVSLDTIEHVGDQRQFLREVDRVVTPGGIVALSTPNRFSLAAEPHVAVWGVGWLPRTWQADFVRWRSGKPYEFCRLLSVPELCEMLARDTRLIPEVIVPRIPAEDLRRFGRGKALVARCYNALSGLSVARPFFKAVGPFFRVIARKPAS